MYDLGFTSEQLAKIRCWAGIEVRLHQGGRTLQSDERAVGCIHRGSGLDRSPCLDLAMECIPGFSVQATLIWVCELEVVISYMCCCPHVSLQGPSVLRCPILPPTCCSSAAHHPLSIGIPSLGSPQPLTSPLAVHPPSPPLLTKLFFVITAQTVGLQNT